MADNTMTVRGICPICDKPSSVVVSKDGYNAWLLGGERIQAALPDLTPGEQETLISGCHEECYDKAFPEDDDD